ncbi:hypothetical protein DMUE_4877 [Dictyocoela muelleri]|nr:hypothetical protein DMUE_4877 [Dictyocoela muelleri]
MNDEIISEDLFFCEEDDFFEISEHQAIDQWFDVGDHGNSFFIIISRFLYDSDDRHFIIRSFVIKTMKKDEELKDIFDEEYINKVSLSGSVASESEIYATAKLFSLDINIFYSPETDCPSHSYRFKIIDEKNCEINILKYK